MLNIESVAVVCNREAEAKGAEAEEREAKETEAKETEVGASVAGVDETGQLSSNLSVFGSAVSSPVGRDSLLAPSVAPLDSAQINPMEPSDVKLVSQLKCFDAFLYLGSLLKQLPLLSRLNIGGFNPTATVLATLEPTAARYCGYSSAEVDARFNQLVESKGQGRLCFPGSSGYYIAALCGLERGDVMQVNEKGVTATIVDLDKEDPRFTALTRMQTTMLGSTSPHTLDVVSDIFLKESKAPLASVISESSKAITTLPPTFEALGQAAAGYLRALGVALPECATLVDFTGCGGGSGALVTTMVSAIKDMAQKNPELSRFDILIPGVHQYQKYPSMLDIVENIISSELGKSINVRTYSDPKEIDLQGRGLSTLILINNPNNPCGGCLTAQEADGLLRLGAAHLLNDAAYSLQNSDPNVFLVKDHSQTHRTILTEIYAFGKGNGNVDQRSAGIYTTDSTFQDALKARRESQFGTVVPDAWVREQQWRLLTDDRYIEATKLFIDDLAVTRSEVINLFSNSPLAPIVHENSHPAFPYLRLAVTEEILQVLDAHYKESDPEFIAQLQRRFPKLGLEGGIKTDLHVAAVIAHDPEFGHIGVSVGSVFNDAGYLRVAVGMLMDNLEGVRSLQTMVDKMSDVVVRHSLSGNL